MSEPIPETVKIIKISATTQKLSDEVFKTIYPTLFIFDAEQSPGKGQPAVYELSLSEFISDDRKRIQRFHLPANSAFVGNKADILPELVIEGGLQDRFVMSAPIIILSIIWRILKLIPEIPAPGLRVILKQQD